MLTSPRRLTAARGSEYAKSAIALSSSPAPAHQYALPTGSKPRADCARRCALFISAIPVWHRVIHSRTAVYKPRRKSLVVYEQLTRRVRFIDLAHHIPCAGLTLPLFQMASYYFIHQSTPHSYYYRCCSQSPQSVLPAVLCYTTDAFPYLCSQRTLRSSSVLLKTSSKPSRLASPSTQTTSK